MHGQYPTIGETFANRYMVQSELGRGGMGVVFRAFDTQRKQSVALKVVHPSLSREAHIFDRFSREIKALRQLNHPNIVMLLDDGEHEGMLYFTMEITVGPTLANYADPADLLPLQQVVYLFGQVCSALSHAHNRGVIHRDLKPTNIIIQDGKAVKLLDFGLARVADDSALTLPGQALGTAAYMAPEVGRGEKASASSDIYALGCLFFQLACGRLPYEGENPIDLILAHQQQPIPPLRELRHDVTDNMNRAVQRALDKNPKRRYETPLDFFKRLSEDDDSGGFSSTSWPSINLRGDASDIAHLIPPEHPWTLQFEEPVPGAGVLGCWKVTISPDGEWLALGADAIEGPLLFNIRARQWSRLGDHGAGRNVRSICWSRSGRLLTFVNSRRLVLVDMATNQCMARLDVTNHRPWAVALLPTPSGRPMPLACGESGGVVAWRDWPDSSPQVFRAHQGVTRDILLVPGGGYFVTGGLDSSLVFWRSSDFRMLRRLDYERSAVWGLAFSKTGEFLATCTSNEAAPVEVLVTGDSTLERHPLPIRGRALCCAFSQSERSLAVGLHEKIAFLEFQPQTRRWALKELLSIGGEVRSIAFGPADRTLFAVTSLGRLLAFRRDRSTSSREISSNKPSAAEVSPISG